MTPKQYKCLLEICLSTRQKGYSPSYEELRLALGLKSRSGISRLVEILEKKQYITRDPNFARSIRINDHALPVPLIEELEKKISQSSATPLSPEATLHTVSYASPHRRSTSTPSIPSLAGHNITHLKSFTPLPFYGAVAAGTPFEALSDNGSIDVPAFLLSHGTHYSLEARGDSMEGAGIIDGDILIIQSEITPRSGHIVVALVDQTNVTLKYYYADHVKQPNTITLKAANTKYEDIVRPTDDIIIQGRLVGMMRRYT